jgi:hypothetical protein
MPTTNKTKEITVSTTIDYAKLAATLDYAAVEKKLEQLTQRDPPRKRKTVADVLKPLRQRLLDLHSKGWSASQLADELKSAGVTVSAARLRECLSGWMTGGDGAQRLRTRRRLKRPPADAQPTTTAVHSGRVNESQPGQRVTMR